MDMHESSISCGVWELSVLDTNDLADELFEVLRDENGTIYDYENNVYKVNPSFPQFAFVIFSDLARKSSPGHRVAKFITDNGLGEISSTVNKPNPNSGNTIKIWTWTVNRKALNKWFTYKFLYYS